MARSRDDDASQIAINGLTEIGPIGIARWRPLRPALALARGIMSEPDAEVGLG
jgi:hypothetical protein